MYRDRWAVEHLPLVAKPMLGCGQAFVFGKESRLRRVLNRLDFSELPVLGGQLRKKASMTSHLVKGVEGHRRQKSPKAGQEVLQNA